MHGLGWREAALTDGQGLRAVDPAIAPVSTALGVLGMPGLTAFVGIVDIGDVREGETVFVSGAAGAVGSIAAQLAHARGARVVGSAGTTEKVAWLDELGLDGVFDYRESPTRDALRELAPDGIDVYFDNVGGETLEAAIGAMRRSRPHRRLWLDLAVQRDRGAAGAAQSVHRRDEAPADAGLPRLRPRRPVPGVPRGGRRRASGRNDPLSRDDRRRHRAGAGGVHRDARGREHREDARPRRPRAEAYLCRSSGTASPRRSASSSRSVAPAARGAGSAFASTGRSVERVPHDAT